MSNATSPRDPGVKTATRVYTVDRYGTVTAQRGATAPSKFDRVAAHR